MLALGGPGMRGAGWGKLGHRGGARSRRAVWRQEEATGAGMASDSKGNLIPNLDTKEMVKRKHCFSPAVFH